MEKLTPNEIEFLLHCARNNRDNSAGLAEIPTQRWREAHKTEVERMDKLIPKLEAMKAQAAAPQLKKQAPQMDRNQKKAAHQIRYAIYDIAGGYENSVTDGQMQESELPSFTELRDEVYDGIMNNTYDEGSVTLYPQKEIKFCSREWLLAQIEKRLTKYMDEEAEYTYKR